MPKKYWAYRHQSGHIHLKRYWGDEAAKDALDDAYDSPFVERVLDPFEAETYDEAVKIARNHLRPDEQKAGS